MTHADARRTDKNVGGAASRSIPDDRYIVAAVFVLMDDDGNFSTYTHEQRPMIGFASSPPPGDETLLDVGAMIAEAWALANLITTEEDN